MKTRRILMVSKRFWPVSGETEMLAAAFASQLASEGHSVDVVTWRMVKPWPDEFLFGRCTVFRLPKLQRAHWPPTAMGYYGRNRWHRSFQRWIAGHHTEYDGAIVFEFDDDLMAPGIATGKSGMPAVIRIEQNHLTGINQQNSRDIQQLQSRATQFVTPDHQLFRHSPTIRNGLLGDVDLIADGWPSDEPVEEKKTPFSRQKARAILERVHPVFHLEPAAILAVCGSELTYESGVFALVRAWRGVLAAHPTARLWMIGNGKNTTELFKRICDLDMQNSVLLTGSFDEIRDVLVAADVYIMPGGGDRPGWYSNMASQLGSTVIHHKDAPVARSFSDSVYRIPFDDDSRSIDLVVSRWASSMGRKRDADDQNRQQNEHEHRVSMKSMTDQYLQLIDRLQSQDGP